MYFAMDMGTTNTRLWLCDAHGVVDTRRAPFGAKLGGLEGKEVLYARLRALIWELLEANKLDEAAIECILTSGMSGSEMAICEIPHTPIPSDLYRTAEAVSHRSIPEITKIPFWFVPGLCRLCGEKVDDMMRGEETETLGILPHLPSGTPAVLVLPGTHNKIIRINAAGEIVDFRTTLCGEMLDLLVSKSILSGSVSHDFTISEAEVLHGSAYAEANGLGAALFHARVMARGGSDLHTVSSFLYGAVIGEDAREIAKHVDTCPVYVGGNARLQQVYCILLRRISAVALDREICNTAVLSGLREIYWIHQAHTHRQASLHAVEAERLIAILRAPDPSTLIPAAEALYEGGVRLLEVTFDRSGKHTRAEIGAMIASLATHFEGRMRVGAGTVTSREEVMEAFRAGAAFIISPNCDPEIIRLTRRLGMVSIPAAYTATEIASALQHGADFIKLFPADGVSAEYIKAIKAPLSDAKLLAVGGVNAENAGEFLNKGFCGVGVGSNLFDKSLIAAKRFDALRELASAYVKAVKET